MCKNLPTNLDKVPWSAPRTLADMVFRKRKKGRSKTERELSVNKRGDESDEISGGLLEGELISPTLHDQPATIMLIDKLKRNLVPTLAVIIVPVGYFIGVTWREARDEQALRQSMTNQRENLERQKAALEEELNVLQEKRRMLEETRRYKEHRDNA